MSEHTPSTEQVRDVWISAMTTEDPDNGWDAISDEEARARWSRWLAAHDARVRRDAAREALDGLAATHDAQILAVFGTRNSSWVGQEARIYRDTHYPEGDDK